MSAALFGVPLDTVVLLALQLAFPALMACFGVAALRVARRGGTAPPHGAWLPTGVAFAMIGAVATAHAAWAAWAVFAGPESGVYAAYLRWLPAANDARSSAMLGYVVLLAVVAALRRGAPRAGWVAAGMVACMVAGAVVGGLGEGAFTAPVHYLVLSAFDAATVILLLAALYLALVRHAFDYLLWVALAIYAAREVLMVNFMGMLALDILLGGQGMLVVSVISMALMVECTRRRLAAAREGRDVPTLLERVGR
jgi:hypothetical protein